MAGKYLLQNCLCVEDGVAVNTVNTLIQEESPQRVYTSAFNRVPQERRAFLKKVKINKA
ncbi:hypothetical protein [Methanolobus sp.]|uniref:hypothetical protein n=1 Tax=Methanolobus sp. TaxID=1874737 RepID=UPI0025CECEBF|nr:hypothetical protein [Methanolobus sp.]